MASIIDSIISLEKEADAIIDEAHTRSKNIIKASDDEIAGFRNELSLELEATLAGVRAEEEKNFAESIAALKKKHMEQLDALKNLPADFIRLHTDRIIDRFNNW